MPRRKTIKGPSREEIQKATKDFLSQGGQVEKLKINDFCEWEKLSHRELKQPYPKIDKTVTENQWGWALRH